MDSSANNSRKIYWILGGLGVLFLTIFLILFFVSRRKTTPQRKEFFTQQELIDLDKKLKERIPLSPNETSLVIDTKLADYSSCRQQIGNSVELFFESYKRWAPQEVFSSQTIEDALNKRGGNRNHLFVIAEHATPPCVFTVEYMAALQPMIPALEQKMLDFSKAVKDVYETAKRMDNYYRNSSYNQDGGVQAKKLDQELKAVVNQYNNVVRALDPQLDISIRKYIDEKLLQLAQTPHSALEKSFVQLNSDILNAWTSLKQILPVVRNTAPSTDMNRLDVLNDSIKQGINFLKLYFSSSVDDKTKTSTDDVQNVIKYADFFQIQLNRFIERYKKTPPDRFSKDESALIDKGADESVEGTPVAVQQAYNQFARFYGKINPALLSE